MAETKERNYIKDDEIKLHYKNILTLSSEETSAEIDEISKDFQDSTIRRKHIGNVSERNGQTWDTTMEVSLDKERESFENEKNDIVKGFILEKRILSREHEKEKQDLISNFVQERQRMLDSFQEQVKDIECKMSFKPQYKTQVNGSLKTENVFDLTSEANQTNESKIPPNSPGKLLIKLDGNRIMTPEQFLSAMELEERFESEREVIEKSFRKEKHQLKDRLEIEYAKKLSREKEKYGREIAALHKEIGNLRNLKNEVADTWKTQASQLESEFFKERASLERHYAEEKDCLRRRLEERNQIQLLAQREEYDRTIRDLRNELRQIKNEVGKTDRGVQKPVTELRKEIEAQIHAQYESESRVLRQQNEKLNNDIQNLTSEKYEMSRKMREIEQDKTNESKYLKAHVHRANKEHAERAKKLMSQNEKMKIQIASCEKQKEELKNIIQTQETNNRNIEGRFELTERTITQYEDTVTNLRRENSNLSHEINLLRIEKEELSSIISQHNEQERSIKIDAQRIQNEAAESKRKYALIEREKLKLEKIVDFLKKDTEKWKSESKKCLAKLEAYSKETERLRSLLEGERSENKRLHERFKTDAELLRKKETENSTTRTQLENIKSQFEILKTKIESDNEKFCQIESDRQNLKKQVEKYKASENLQNKHELVKIQKNYCKEFTKRLEYVKANYEREIFNLKETIGELTHGSLPKNSQFSPRPQPPAHCKNCTNGKSKRKSLHENINQNEHKNDENNNYNLPRYCQTADHINEQVIRERLLKERNLPTHKNICTQDRATTTSGGSMENFYSRFKQAEVSSNNDELKNLLKDVRKEVLMLNELIDAQSPDITPNITPRLTPPTKQQPANGLIEQVQAANEKALHLQDQLADKESEMNESKDTMNRLYFENNELQRRLDEQQRELLQQENSCDELYRRRLILEKLVDRLQNKLRDETSKRRKLEQVSNAIDEASTEDLDESTV